MRRFLVCSLFILGSLLILAACNSETTQLAETLRINADTLPAAFLNEDYVATIRAVGGLTPYQFSLSAGELPAGISLQGGTLRGVPTREGSYSFTISVSDGRLSSTFREFSLSVTQAPPADIRFNVPQTEVQRPIVIRVDVVNARSLQALRSLIRWDSQLFSLVPGSVRSANDTFVALIDTQEGSLQVDLAVLSGSISGERRVFEFGLTPLEVSTLELTTETEFLGQDGSHAFIAKSEGRRGLSQSEAFDALPETVEDEEEEAP